MTGRGNDGLLASGGAALTHDLGKALPPARMRRMPSKFSLGLRIRTCPYLRHHDDKVLASGEPARPGRHVPRRLRAKHGVSHVLQRWGSRISIAGIRPVMLSQASSVSRLGEWSFIDEGCVRQVGPKSNGPSCATRQT